MITSGVPDATHWKPSETTIITTPQNRVKRFPTFSRCSSPSRFVSGT